MILPGLVLFVLTGTIALTGPLQPNPDLNLPEGYPFWVRITAAFVIGPISIILGGLVTRRFKDNLIGPVLIHWGCATNAELGISHLPAFWGALSLYYLTVVVLSGLVLMLASFPSGRGVTPFWDRTMKGLTLLLMCGYLLLNLSSPAAYGLSEPSPLALTFLIPFHPVLNGITTILQLALVVLSNVLIIYRYRRTHETERKQMRWLIFVAVCIALVIVVATVFQPQTWVGAFRDYWIAFSAFTIFAAPSVGISLAILQHHLWDIDVIIRRTMQYSVLTGLLALIYFGLVVVFQGLFSTLSNQQSEIFIVLSTLAIAALFNPLRRRVQDFIDRRFYRKKYNAEQALAQFAAVARDEVDMDKLAAALLGVVEETMQPEHFSLWLIGDRLTGDR